MDKIRVGIIGTGGISNFHMKGYKYHSKDIEVVACCDINYERAKEYAKEYDIPNVFSDYKEMLKMKDLDAVSVTTWNNAHAPISIAALKAGKHVLCEKPMALNKIQAEEMKKVSEQTGKLLMIGFVRRFGQNTKILKDFINNGHIGEIYRITVKCARRAGNPGGWFSKKELSGGGPLIDLGVHMIDLARYIMGNPSIKSVNGTTFNKLGPRNNILDFERYMPVDFDTYCDVEDMCVASVKFDNGALLNVDVSFSDNIKEDSLEMYVFGTKGGARFEPTLELYTEMDNYLVDITPVYTPEKEPFKDNFIREIGHFISCIKGEAECMNPPADGVAIMEILDSVYLSAQQEHELIF